MHGDDDRDARDDFSHVVDPHDDQPALEELRARCVHDGDARAVARDRLLDALVPDSVAREVEVVEHEPADRPEELGHAPVPVARRRARDREPVPVERVVDGARVEPELA